MARRRILALLLLAAAAADVNEGFIQLILNYNMDGGWYLTSVPVITMDWEQEGDNRWLVPAGGGVGRITKLGSQPLDVQSPKGSCPSSSPGRPPVAREAPPVANDRIAPLLADVDASAPESARSAVARNIAAGARGSDENIPGRRGALSPAPLRRSCGPPASSKQGIQLRTQFATRRARWRGSAERS